jgi:hypothetical protein
MTVSVDFFDDQTFQKIEVNNLNKKIKVIIPRNPSLKNPEFTYVNVSEIEISTEKNLLPNGLNMTMNNSSMLIHLKPISTLIGYFIFVKIGQTPVWNQTHKIYDKLAGFCPNGYFFITFKQFKLINLDFKRVILLLLEMVSQLNDEFYELFVNPVELKGQKGFIGFGIREMSSIEFSTYCSSINSSITIDRLPFEILSPVFTEDFSVRVLTVGCFYFDSNSGFWSSYGVETMATGTNISATVCLTNHLTTFSAGLVILPPSIDFNYVWANADITKNPYIYATVIVCIGLYVLISIFALIIDQRDKKKLGINLLQDNYPTNNYCYELIVFTGNRKDAATDSNVRFILVGDEGETKVRKLSTDQNRKILRKGGIDSFIMAVERFVEFFL